MMKNIYPTYLFSENIYHHFYKGLRMNDPDKYSENLDQFVDIARVLFEKHKTLLQWFPEAESIIDLGIGDGKLTKDVILPIIPTNIQEYIGCDISENMLASAEKTIQLLHFQTRQMDITSENLPSEMIGRFHHVFANYLFHHLQELR